VGASAKREDANCLTTVSLSTDEAGFSDGNMDYMQLEMSTLEPTFSTPQPTAPAMADTLSAAPGQPRGDHSENDRRVRR
jgi:hypothetical protein